MSHAFRMLRLMAGGNILPHAIERFTTMRIFTSASVSLFRHDYARWHYIRTGYRHFLSRHYTLST